MTSNDEAVSSTLTFRKVSSAEDPLLEDFYRLYAQVFTLPEEREPIEGFRQVLRFNDDASIQSNFGPLSEGVLLALDSGTVVGAANYIIYRYPNCISDIAASCQLNFLCVEKSWRNRGIGRRLLEEMEADLSGQAGRVGFTGQAFVTCEQNNPDKMTKEQIADDQAASLMDACDRLRWWRRQGYRRLLFPYNQPPLNPGQAACDYLDYYIRFTQSPSPPAAQSVVLREHLRRFFFVSVGKLAIDMAKNSQWIAIERFLDAQATVEMA